MTKHTEQISSVIHSTVKAVISRGLNDPRIRGLVSVTSVQVSSDLAEALIGVSVMPADRSELTLHGLSHAASHLRGQVARQAGLRRMPKLIFRLDSSLKREAEVLQAIDEGRRRDEELHPSPLGEEAEES